MLASVAEQAVQIAGALLILAAFALAQAHRLDVRSPIYLWLNIVGAGTLAVLAVLEEHEQAFDAVTSGRSGKVILLP